MHYKKQTVRFISVFLEESNDKIKTISDGVPRLKFNHRIWLPPDINYIKYLSIKTEPNESKD